LPVPRTRKGFKTQLFERYHRRQADLDAGIADMFIAGASTAQVGAVVETLTGTKPSPSTVSRVFHSLEEEFQTWKGRRLAARYAYLFVDGTYFSVIYNNEGVKMPIIAAVGIRLTGEREVLAFSTGEHENQKAWEDLFDDLKRRGVQDVGLVISDGGAAPLAALELKFSTAQRQRCIWHKLENILSYVPESQRAQVEPELKAIFYQESRAQADQLAAAFREKYATIYPTALECMARDWEACLTFYAFPRAHWKTIRTNNVMERLFNEVKKRYHKMAAAFRGETSCLLMFFAVIRGMKFRKVSMPAK
jgi:transposase-like protein